MTNFGFLMNTFRLSPNDFLTIGYDHTLISRWRTGKRKLMPGRIQVRTISAMFLQKDSQSDRPIIGRLLNIWYPSLASETPEEKQQLLERFLTEKEQFTEDYGKLREMRLNCLQHEKIEISPASRGIESVRLGLLYFLDLVERLTEPQELRLVFTEGQVICLTDENFGNLFIAKLMRLFGAGHRLSIAIRSDCVGADIPYFHRIRLYTHLKGYITTQYFDIFKPRSVKMLGSAGDCLVFRISRENLWDFDNTYMEILSDPDSVGEITGQIQEYFSLSQPLVRYDFFRNPENYLCQTGIRKERPCYLITGLPHFGIMYEEELRRSFNLNEDETERLRKEFHPFLLSPEYFNDTVPIRHIFNESAIKAALSKQRHQAHAISAMLGRKVWMSSEDLRLLLKRIKTLLKTRQNYEVCFIDAAQFDDISIQIGVWGNEAAVSWLEKDVSAAARDYPVIAGIQSFGTAVWKEITNGMYDRKTATEQINRLLRDHLGKR